MRDTRERYATIGCDCLRNAAGHQQNGPVVIAASQQRNCFPPKSTDLAVRQNAFEPVAYFEAVLVFARRQ
jgi:hypothetical protein